MTNKKSIISISFHPDVLSALETYILSISGTQFTAQRLSRSAVVNNMVRRDLARHGYKLGGNKK